MKNYRKLLAGVMFCSIASLSFVSCLKDEPVKPKAMGDIVIQGVKTAEGVKYGLVIYVSANFDIQSGKVTGPGTPGKIYELVASNSKQQFVYNTPESEYSSELPAKGDYKIEVTSPQGETLYGSDLVGDEKLDPVEIKTLAFESNQLRTTWNKVTGSEAYVVRLYTEDKKEILFSSDYLDPESVKFDFNVASSGWVTAKSPVSGANYVLELLAVLSEAGVKVDKASNLQFVSVDSKKVKWE